MSAGAGDAPAAQDPSRAVYRYHQVFAGPGRTLVRKTLVCAVRLAPWSEGTIRAHEATHPPARDAALDKIRATRGHAEPVVAGFRDAPGEIERLMRNAERARPALELTTADGVVHRVWRVQDAELLGKLRHYFAPQTLHVLDGHHRYEAMLAYHRELADAQPLALYSSAHYGLAYLVNLDDPALATAPRHRVVRAKPGDARRADVLAAAEAQFVVERVDGAAKDVAKLFAALADAPGHQPGFVAVFAGEPDAWRLTLKPEVSLAASGAVHRALQKLDPYAIQAFLDRALLGAKVETETDANAALAAEGADVILIVRPVTIAQIAHVDELNQVLPTGSTALHPPIADGLVRFVIDPDEDLI